MTRRRRSGALAGGLLTALAAAGFAGTVSAGDPAASSATLLSRMAAAPAFREYAETHQNWKLYCQVWSEPRRVECELGTRRASGPRKASRLVWLRSSERWMEGLRFRLEDQSIDIDKGVRLWVDQSLFRPEFPCTRFPYEPGTCAVSDRAVNDRLVERMRSADKVSAVGLSPAGEKVEIFFYLKGFRAALERMEELRRQAGVDAWM
ncbi:hypothetical protein [Azospirillum halopraeferens]|uniref:hypothetical protein n=1 Tax=Azospirillum halopraeferens TaxID=34010 RepID=UPI00048DC8E6|nr:hypothetical protein [Azospirillum halopraeferens]